VRVPESYGDAADPRWQGGEVKAATTSQGCRGRRWRSSCLCRHRHGWCWPPVLPLDARHSSNRCTSTQQYL